MASDRDTRLCTWLVTMPLLGLVLPGCDGAMATHEQDDGLAACRAVEVAAGLNHSCALSGDGRVLCWGENERFQLGPAHTDLARSLTPVVIEVGGPALDIQTESGGSMCARREDAWHCWGRVAPYTRPGALDIKAPLALPFTRDARALEAGSVICVLRPDGQIACLSEAYEPLVLPDLGADNIDVSVVFTGLVCGLKPSGRLQCRNLRGVVRDHEGNPPIISADGGWPFVLLADGQVTRIGAEGTTLARVPAGYREIQGSGDRHTFCVTGAGVPPLCTRNPAWAGGDADAPLVAEPLALPAPVKHLSVGFDHICAALDSGEVYCWGDNRGGQLGIDTGGLPHDTPVRVPLCPE